MTEPPPAPPGRASNSAVPVDAISRSRLGPQTQNRSSRPRPSASPHRFHRRAYSPVDLTIYSPKATQATGHWRLRANPSATHQIRRSPRAITASAFAPASMPGRAIDLAGKVQAAGSGESRFENASRCAVPKSTGSQTIRRQAKSTSPRFWRLIDSTLRPRKRCPRISTIRSWWSSITTIWTP